MFEPLEPRKLFSTVTVAPAKATEPTADATAAATFTATLKTPSAAVVVLSYATADRTAKAGVDYTATTGSITIPAGSTTGTFAVPVLDDDTTEGTETFVVRLKVSAGNRVNATAVATIADSDPAPNVTVDDATVDEPAAGARSTASVTVELANPTTKPVVVVLHTSDDTATAGTDYVSATRRVVIRPGQTSATTTFKILGDDDAESDEAFDVDVIRATNATISTASPFGRVVIRGTDVAVRPTVSVAAATVAEGSAGTTTTLAFTLTLSEPSTQAVTVGYATSDGTATAGTDYTAAGGTVTFAAGQTSQTVDVAVIGDDTAEADETVLMTLTAPVNATLGTATAIGTITNDDGAIVTTPTPTLSVSPATAAEGAAGATSTLSFAVTLSAAQASAITVHYATADGTATAGTDYTAASGTLTFAAGETAKTVSVTVAGDTTVESDETLTLTLSSPTGATLATASATGTITNDDSATGTATTGTTLSDNTTAASGGTESAIGSGWLAAAFDTGSAAVTLSSVTLPIAMTTAGSLSVSVYSDAGLQPGSLVGALTSPSSYATSLTAATFTGSVSLSASTTYWVVVRATSGAFTWSWTDDNAGTGTGYTGEWASTADAGSTWFSSDAYPLQMKVTVA